MPTTPTNGKIKVYYTLPPSSLKNNEKLLAKILFNLPSLDNKNSVFSVDEKGFISYTVKRILCSKYLIDAREAEKIAYNFFIKSNNMIHESVLNKILPTDFPFLFQPYLKLYAPLSLIYNEETKQKYWQLHFKPYLKLYDGLQKDVGIVEEDNIYMCISSCGILVSLRYEHLPIIYANNEDIRILSALYNYNNDSIFMESNNISTPLPSLLMHRFNNVIIPYYITASGYHVSASTRRNSSFLPFNMGYEILPAFHHITIPNVVDAIGVLYTYEKTTIHLKIFNASSITSPLTLENIVKGIETTIGLIWNRIDYDNKINYEITVTHEFIATEILRSDAEYNNEKIVFIKFIDNVYNNGWQAWGGTTAKTTQQVFINISVYQKMPQISLYDVNFDDFLTAGVRKQNHINRTAAHELLTHGGRISHIFSADSPEYSKYLQAIMDRNNEGDSTTSEYIDFVQKNLTNTWENLSEDSWIENEILFNFNYSSGLSLDMKKEKNDFIKKNRSRILMSYQGMDLSLKQIISIINNIKSEQ